MGIEWVFRMRILTEYYFWIALFSLCDPKTTWGRGHDACFIHFHHFMPQRGIIIITYYYCLSLLALRWRYTVFQGQYLPSLSINYVAINKDLEKLLPQLHQMKMKICYDQGCSDIGVVIATK